VGSIDRKKCWVFYGRSGTGKTTLASTFPGKKLLLDVRDEGTDSVSDIEDLFVKDIREWADFDTVYESLMRDDEEYDYIIIDTFTQAQQLFVEHVASKKALKGRLAGDWGTMTKSDWGEVASTMKEFVSDWRELPMGIIFIAQEKMFDTPEDEALDTEIRPHIGPASSPSVKDHLCAASSVIGNTFINNRTKKIKIGKRTKEKEVAEYCLRLGPHPSYITKIRKPKSVVVPDFITDPTYEDIMAIIKGDE